MTQNADLEAVLREYGAAQHGVVSREQLLSAGISGNRIDRHVRSGRLLLLHRGVYQAGTVPGARARELAAVLACGAESRVSHLSAAALYDWVAGNPARAVDVTMARRTRRRITGIRVHRVRRLLADEATVLQGVRATTPARTLLDLGACAAVREVEQAYAKAERAGLLTPAAVQAMAERHPTHRGAALLRRVLADEAPPALTRSEAEAELLALVRRARIRAPELNVWIQDYLVDFLWRKERLVVEVDGFEFHRSARAFAEDRRRDATLTTAGYTVLRFTWDDVVNQREATLVRIVQALARLAA